MEPRRAGILANVFKPMFSLMRRTVPFRPCWLACALIALACGGCVSEPTTPPVVTTAAAAREAAGAVQRPADTPEAAPSQTAETDAAAGAELVAAPSLPQNQAEDELLEEHAPVLVEDENAASTAIAKGTRKGHLQAVGWADVPGWAQDNPAEAWGAFLQSCPSLSKKSSSWRTLCAEARAQRGTPDNAFVRAFFERHLQPWRVIASESVVTGYYEPLIEASRVRGGEYQWPIYGPPRDLVRVNLADAVPELRAHRLRGRVVRDDTAQSRRQVVPYWSRKQIREMGSAFPAKTLLWAKDPIDVFFLQVQGSGQAELPNGERVRVAFAEHNGHPYRSIGRWLVSKGELNRSQSSMQGIKDWVRAHPERLNELLDINPAFVFFKLKPTDGLGPAGALSVPLTPGRSVAVDRRFIPLGTPLFLATTYPNAPSSPLRRMVMAQDTGTAIVGAARVDLFWGFGEEAGQQAGRMNQRGELWLLWPKGEKPPAGR